MKSPVLILGAIADDIGAIAELRQYEQALRAAGKTVEAHYYEGVSYPLDTDDAIGPTIEFFSRYLK